MYLVDDQCLFQVITAAKLVPVQASAYLLFSQNYEFFGVTADYFPMLSPVKLRAMLA